MSPNNFNEYLQNMVCDKNSKNEVTHTNIGSKKHNIYGASYTINNNEEFLNLYFKQLKLEENYYLTEKQLNSDNRMLVVDMDFKYQVLTDLENIFQQNLAKFKVPREIKILDELPRNAMGKIQKNTIQRLID